MKTYAIIPSGGRGKRAATNLPKQYLKFNGKELIAFTIEIFQQCEYVDNIIVSAEQQYFDLINSLKEEYNLYKLMNPVEGGKERQDSVDNALSSFSFAQDDIIVVHDAVRPLLPSNVLESAIMETFTYGSVVTAIHAKDTLIKGNESVIDYIDRKEIYYAQTPQVFRYSILKNAMEKAFQEGFYGTDESMLVKRASNKIKIVEGSSLNFKITTESDLKLFGLISQSM
jgi:2-C-methyl-D-erythritol 4-phosphate cytidylyltransferase